ncbi:MAG: peptidase M24 [Candidatus Gottesmanbacteria bacterium GW2011_GWA2_43_14]|uniref:Peptidase M24 n=1 Tax=Candidatus Gottesmanbacteria bacterium GW2011_GWA2_43_14 TaxID=1618443 RepID=A0A0G1FNU0_9BACT|nr:MAG: peptidase M24 [Candidatus Gottesmanbacteria bacterium GW2011_GWA2_43_14]
MDKIKIIRRFLEEKKIPALFVSGQENVTYLTGICGLSTGDREAFLLLTLKNAYLLAFSTTIGMYIRSGFDLIEITTEYRLSQALNDLTGNFGRLAFEKNNLTYSEFESLKNNLKVPLIPTENIIENLRAVKTLSEIVAIEKAAQTTDRAYKYALKIIKKSITEKELALDLEIFIRKNSQDIAFSPIVAFNENSAIPHYLPSEKIKLADNSLVLIDMGAKYDNYCADLTRVVFFGTPADKQIEMFNKVTKANELAVSSLAVGKTGEEIDTLTRNFIQNNGFTAYKHGLGHGVGLAIHEAPRLKPQIKDVLAANMVFTIEPGIYIKGFAGVRIEDVIHLTAVGPRILSKASKELTVL